MPFVEAAKMDIKQVVEDRIDRIQAELEYMRPSEGGHQGSYISLDGRLQSWVMLAQSLDQEGTTRLVAPTDETPLDAYAEGVKFNTAGLNRPEGSMQYAKPATSGLNFSQALAAMREGKRMRRPQWHLNMNNLVAFLFIEDGNIREERRWGEGNHQSFFVKSLLTADLLATDWEIVNK